MATTFQSPSKVQALLNRGAIFINSSSRDSLKLPDKEEDQIDQTITSGKICALSPQHMINVIVSKKPPFDEIKEVQQTIKKAEDKLGDDSRVLVHCPDTQRMALMRALGESKADYDRWVFENKPAGQHIVPRGGSTR